MQLDFAAILVIAAFVTGTIWLWDKLILARQRARTFDLGSSVGAANNKTGSTQKLPWYVDFSRSFFPVILAVLVLRSFVVEPFRIPSGSMEPTLLPGDFILVNKFSYGLRLPVINTKIIDFGLPERGDVTVFRYPEDPAIAFIKRIVGLPGDRLQYRNKQLYINDEPVPLEELSAHEEGGKPGYRQLRELLAETPHRILLSNGPSIFSREYKIPEGHYFVLGDNRDNSRDSRYWGFLPEQNLIGNAFLIWMNWDCITGNGHCNRIGSSIK